MTEAIGVLVFLGIIHGFSLVVHLRERRDLLDRLMARDLPEFKTWEVEEKRAPRKLYEPPNNNVEV